MSAIRTSTIRRLILGAACGAVGALAFSSPARADDATQPPGGVLGAVAEVVEQVLPEPTRAPKPAEPEPEPEPEPSEEPADEPKPAEPEQDSHTEQGSTDDKPPATEPVIDVPPIVVPIDVPPVVIDVPPIIVDVPPVPVDVPPVVVVTPPVAVVVPPVVVATPTTPATTPAQTTQPAADASVTAPPAADTATATVPTTATVLEQEPTLEPTPVDLPVIGPTATTPIDDDGTWPPQAQPDRAPRAATCDGHTDQDDTADRTPGDGKQQRRSQNAPRRDASKKTPGKPCPTPAGPDGQATTAAGVKPPPPTGEQLIADSAAGAYSRPVLHRLAQLRPRSHTLAGRTEHPEPGPA